MKPDRHTRKNRHRLETESLGKKERDRLSKAKKSIKLRKKMDWRDIPMEEEDHLSQNP